MGSRGNGERDARSPRFCGRRKKKKRIDSLFREEELNYREAYAMWRHLNISDNIRIQVPVLTQRVLSGESAAMGWIHFTKTNKKLQSLRSRNIYIIDSLKKEDVLINIEDEDYYGKI